MKKSSLKLTTITKVWQSKEIKFMQRLQYLLTLEPLKCLKIYAADTKVVVNSKVIEMILTTI